MGIVRYRDTAIPSGLSWRELAQVKKLPEQQIVRIREYLDGTGDDDLVHTQWYGVIAGNIGSTGDNDDVVERLIIVGEDGTGRTLRRSSVEVIDPSMLLDDVPAIYLGTAKSDATGRPLPWCVVDGSTGEKRQSYLVCNRSIALELFAQIKLGGTGGGVAWQGSKMADRKLWKDLDETKFMFDVNLVSSIESNTVGFLRGDLADALRSWEVAPRRGVLLAGLPGNGKTVLTRVMGKRALNGGVNLVVLDVQSLQDDLGEQLRLAASRAPVLIVIDDLDLHVGKRQGSLTAAGVDNDHDVDDYRYEQVSRWRERALATFLEFLDGVVPREGYALLATTNFSEQMDASLLRAGRFDVIVNVVGPSFDARVSLLRRFTALPDGASTLDVTGAATLLDGCSFADLAEVGRRYKIAVVYRHGHATTDQEALDETTREYAVERLHAVMTEPSA